MMDSRISMISLGVSDLEAAITFYRDGLGLHMIESPPGVAFFKLNGTWLGLANRENLASDAGISHEGTGYSGINLVHNVTSEEEVIKLIELVRSAGATIIKEPQKAVWGGFHAYFKDLDSHLWEIAYNPFMWIGPEAN
ncbi:VOC family protein [Aquimarina rhabdastrellae]